MAQDDSDRITSKTNPELVGKRVGFCPNGHRMVIRINRDDDTLFLGCSRYPECRETHEIPTHIFLELEGAKPLPGFSISEDDE
jgi:ssDNA-binding Zn-finger/Zn-ribbon topoisomerase 1